MIPTFELHTLRGCEGFKTLCFVSSSSVLSSLPLTYAYMWWIRCNCPESVFTNILCAYDVQDILLCPSFTDVCAWKYNPECLAINSPSLVAICTPHRVSGTHSYKMGRLNTTPSSLRRNKRPLHCLSGQFFPRSRLNYRCLRQEQVKWLWENAKLEPRTRDLNCR